MHIIGENNRARTVRVRTNCEDISRNCEESVFGGSAETRSVDRSLNVSVLGNKLQTFLEAP